MAQPSRRTCRFWWPRVRPAAGPSAAQRREHLVRCQKIGNRPSTGFGRPKSRRHLHAAARWSMRGKWFANRRRGPARSLRVSQGRDVSDPCIPRLLASLGGRPFGGRPAGWETRETADLEVCGTKNPPRTSGCTVSDRGITGGLTHLYKWFNVIANGRQRPWSGGRRTGWVQAVRRIFDNEGGRRPGSGAASRSGCF